MKVIQVGTSVSYGDAVGNDIVAIYHALKEFGYETGIYAEHIDKRVKDIVEPIKKMPQLEKNDIILYYVSISTPLNYELEKWNGIKVVIYHNITPAYFFYDINPGLADACAQGIKEMKYLANVADYGIADSEFNKQNMLDMGFSCPIDVMPILVPFDDYKKEPDQSTIEKYTGDGYTNLLFVGRIAPNKCHEDIISMFYQYKKYCNPKSRLFFIGNDGGMEIYAERLNDYIDKLGLTSQDVIFTGHITFAQILAYYKLSDAFICMSEHEGFCVPLLEAMCFDKPILAYDSCAVPWTLGGSGLLTSTKDPLVNAKLLEQLLSNHQLKETVLANQKERLEFFAHDRIKKQLKDIIENISKE